MEIHGYTEGGSIKVTVDGQLSFVPDDMANRHRRMIAEWEAEGNTIPPYVPPPEPEPSPEEVLKQAMFDEFVDRMIKNKTAPAKAKEVARKLRGLDAAQR